MSTNADIVLFMKDTDAEVDNFIFQSCDKLRFRSTTNKFREIVQQHYFRIKQSINKNSSSAYTKERKNEENLR